MQVKIQYYVEQLSASGAFYCCSLPKEEKPYLRKPDDDVHPGKVLEVDNLFPPLPLVGSAQTSSAATNFGLLVVAEIEGLALQGGLRVRNLTAEKQLNMELDQSIFQ